MLKLPYTAGAEESIPVIMTLSGKYMVISVACKICDIEILRFGRRMVRWYTPPLFRLSDVILVTKTGRIHIMNF